MRSPDYYKSIFLKVINDPRYLNNLDWGRPRPGHPEGSIRAHIAELEENLEKLRERVSDEDYWKLKLLIHVHDTFKAVADPDVPISDPLSHASLARKFLADYCDDGELLTIVQNHDVPFALFKHFRRKHALDAKRFENLLASIANQNLFIAFLIIDGSTRGKSPEPLKWFFRRIRGRVETQWSEADILSPAPVSARPDIPASPCLT